MGLIDVNELEGLGPVFRGKCGNAFARLLMRMLSVDRINDLYDRHLDVAGPEFAREVLADIGMKYRIGFGPDAPSGDDSLEILDRMLPEGPFITVSNHPCGHVDGIALVDIFGHVRPGYKVMVNSMLSRIAPMGPSFISVTPTGERRTAPTAASIAGVKAALAQLRSGRALGLFPSGAVSDLSLTERRIRDREWQDAVVRLIMKARVPVLPVRFFDGNSAFYYSLGLISWKVRLLRLPAEVFNKAERPMRIGIGPLLSVAAQDAVLASSRLHPAENSGLHPGCHVPDASSDSASISAFREFLRSQVYGMSASEMIWH